MTKCIQKHIATSTKAQKTIEKALSKGEKGEVIEFLDYFLREAVWSYDEEYYKRAVELNRKLLNNEI